MTTNQGSSLLPRALSTLTISLFPCPKAEHFSVFTASQTGTEPRQNLDSTSQATFVAVPTDSDGFQLQLGSQTRADRLANTGPYMDPTGEEKSALAATVRRPDSITWQSTLKATPEAMPEMPDLHCTS